MTLREQQGATSVTLVARVRGRRRRPSTTSAACTRAGVRASSGSIAGSPPRPRARDDRLATVERPARVGVRRLDRPRAPVGVVGARRLHHHDNAVGLAAWRRIDPRHARARRHATPPQLYGVFHRGRFGPRGWSTPTATAASPPPRRCSKPSSLSTSRTAALAVHHARAVCVPPRRRHGSCANTGALEGAHQMFDRLGPAFRSAAPGGRTRGVGRWDSSTDLRFAARTLLRVQGTRRHGDGHARARHWRQRRHLQRGPRRAAAAARQSRRGSADLHPPERAGPRRREHHVLGARDPGFQGAASRPSARSAISRPSTSP